MKYLYGDTLMWILLVEYILIAVAFGIDGNYPKVLYFVGAGILTLGVLWMS